MKEDFLKIDETFSINKIQKIKYGEIYIVFSSKFNIQKEIFKDYKERTSFINSPFKEAIKVPIYFEKKFKILETVKQEINNSDFSPFKIERYSLIEKILVVMINELSENDIAVVETTGLANDSIYKLLTFSSNYLAYHLNKAIIVVDFNFVNNQKSWITLYENQQTLEDILYSIPLSTRKPEKYPFYIQE